MPFTAAHPLAVLPLLRRWRLDSTCLVIGAMAPDFQYFAAGEEKGAFSHTLLGIPLWGLPVTLGLAVVFHTVAKWPLYLAAPQWLARRVAPQPWRLRPIACTVSALIGVVTHIAWDGGTHANGWGETHFRQAFGHMVTVPVLGHVPLFRVFQHVSTLIGLAGISAYLVVQLRRQRPLDVAPPRARVRVVLAACVIAGIAALLGRALYMLHVEDPGSLVVATISGTLAGTLVASAALSADGAAARRRALERSDSGSSPPRR